MMQLIMSERMHSHTRPHNAWACCCVSICELSPLGLTILFILWIFLASYFRKEKDKRRDVVECVCMCVC